MRWGLKSCICFLLCRKFTGLNWYCVFLKTALFSLLVANLSPFQFSYWPLIFKDWISRFSLLLNIFCLLWCKRMGVVTVFLPYSICRIFWNEGMSFCREPIINADLQALYWKFWFTRPLLWALVCEPFKHARDDFNMQLSLGTSTLWESEDSHWNLYSGIFSIF